MHIHDLVKWIKQEVNRKRKVSDYEEKTKHRKNANICNYYECLKNGDGESKEEVEDDTSQVGSNQESSKAKEDNSECSVVKRSPQPTWIL